MAGRPEDKSGDGFRQIQFIFNPWENGWTTCTVATVDYRGDRRFLHRIGSVRLGIGRQDLVGLSASEVARLLSDRLQDWLSDEASTLPRPKAPAPPEGVKGAALTQVPGQLSLDLDLRE